MVCCQAPPLINAQIARSLYNSPRSVTMSSLCERACISWLAAPKPWTSKARNWTYIEAPRLGCVVCVMGSMQSNTHGTLDELGLGGGWVSFEKWWSRQRRFFCPPFEIILFRWHCAFLYAPPFVCLCGVCPVLNQRF